MRQLFIDLDGVLADMDGFYERHFHVRLNRLMESDPPGLWDNIIGYGRFFYELPLMPDAMTLWQGVQKLHPRPAILTGVPWRYPEAEGDKRAWVARHLGPDVPVFTSQSKNKRDHGKPGDILVDDWFKWRHRWEDMGGIFVLHTSAADSLMQLEKLLYEPHASSQSAEESAVARPEEPARASGVSPVDESPAACADDRGATSRS